MDAASEQKSYTVDDIEALPEGERAELIDGQIYYMASPNTRHQRLVGDFFYKIKQFIESKNGDCEVFPAPFAVYINKDKNNYVEPDISVICDKDKIYEDFTIKVEQLQEDIENRKKLVRNLSHEIKSPVAVIMGYADRMKTVIADNLDKAKKYCEIISDESSRIDILVKEILEFSKLEQEYGEPNKESFEATRLFEDLKKRFYQENVETKITYEDSFVANEYINADYIMMERAVYNLIRNAVTYVTGETPLIKVTGTSTDGYYVISVYNSGSSIPDEDRQTIWEPFGKVDKVRGRSKRGYGLGLSIVREIVEKHEGRYRVDNLDDGVSFVISFKQ